MTDSELDDELEKFKKLSGAYRYQIEEYLKNAARMHKTEKQAKEDALNYIKIQDQAGKRYKKTAEELDATLKGLEKNFKTGQLTVEELDEELNLLRREVNRTTDQAKKKLLLEQKQALEEAVLRDKTTKSYKDALGQLGGTLISETASAFSKATQRALSSGSAIQTAGAFMEAGIDVANKSVQVGAKGLSDFGSAAIMAGPKLRVVGVSAAVAGAALSALGNTVSELAKAGISFMIAQTQKTIETFRTMSQSGAVFGNGMLEMRKEAAKAGISLDDLSKVTVAQKENYAKAGLSVSGGMKRTVDALKTGGESMRKELFALGYSMQDQASMVGEVMANMAGPSKRLAASDAELAAQTKHYAENLQLVTALTGEDAKAKQEAIRKENDTLVMQQKIDQMGEAERARFNEALTHMTDFQRRALRERMIYGTIRSADIAIAEAQNEGIRQENEALYNNYKQQNLSSEAVINAHQKYGQSIRDANMANTAMATAADAAGGAVGDAAKGMLEVQKMDLNYTKENIEKTREAQEKAERDAKKDPLVEVQEKERQMGVEIERIATKHLPEFAKAVNQTIDAIKGSVNALANMSASAATTPPWLTALIGAAGSLASIVGLLIQAKTLGSGGGIIGPGGAGGGAAGPKPTIGQRIAGAGTAAKNFATAPRTAATIAKGVGAGGIAGLAGMAAGAAGMNKTSAALEGAGVGATIGSFLGPAGTLIGAGIGGAIGLYRGFAQEKEDARNYAYQLISGKIEDLDDVPPDLKPQIKEILANPPREFLREPGNTQRLAELHNQGFAEGGVATGPTSGYKTTLHGTEAIIPLGNNKSIPVDIDFDALAQKLSAAMSVSITNSTSSDMKDLLDAVNRQMDKHDEMISQLKENVDINQRILNNSYA